MMTWTLRTTTPPPVCFPRSMLVAGQRGLLSVWLTLSVSGSQAACAVVL